MGRDAEAAGWEVRVGEPLLLPKRPDKWCVLCQVHAVTSPAFVREADAFFPDLANRHFAVYDGWEASVKPSGWRANHPGDAWAIVRE